MNNIQLKRELTKWKTRCADYSFYIHMKANHTRWGTIKDDLDMMSFYLRKIMPKSETIWQDKKATIFEKFILDEINTELHRGMICQQDQKETIMKRDQ